MNAKYPSIGFDTMFDAIDFVYNQPKFRGEVIPRALIELCFQSATSADGISALKGSMKRAELLNFLLRFCQVFLRSERKSQKKKKKLTISECFPRFLRVFVDPIIENSYIIEDRILIRASKKLNDFLFSNRHSLMKMFEDAKRWDPFSTNGKLGFTIRAAREFFYHFKTLEIIDVNHRIIEESFVASLMTVIDEVNNRKKYDYLAFVEFEEMLCRIVIKGLDPDVYPEPLAWKVQYFVEQIYLFYDDRGLFKDFKHMEDYKLHKTVSLFP